MGRIRGTGILTAVSIIIVVVLAWAIGAVAAPGGGHGPVAPTAGGRVQGKTAGGMEEYLGIPYAAPPVGALRWRPPRPAAPWPGVREATSFAPHCPQSGLGASAAGASENCLYLNVFAPAGAAHAFELQYLFGLGKSPYPGTLSAPQRRLSQAMTSDWTNLAKTGVPAAAWPRWTAADQRTLSLVPPDPRLETGYAAGHHCSFWNANENQPR